MQKIIFAGLALTMIATVSALRQDEGVDILKIYLHKCFLLFFRIPSQLGREP